MLAHGIGTPESPIHCRYQGWGYRCARSLALDAKVIIYWYDHGSDLLILNSIAVTENLWILVKNETKLWLCETAIVTVSNQIKHRFQPLTMLVTLVCCRPFTATAIRSIGVRETADGIDNE